MNSPARPLQLRERARLDIAAASGLVLRDDLLHVIADDGLMLHRYTLPGQALTPLPLFPGSQRLPDEHHSRKKRKPDLEALALLPDGSLLALGSGSKENRMRACHLARGDEAVRHIDLEPLYAVLQRDFPELNIEGAIAWRDHLLLAQRGNGRDGINALVLLDLPTALDELARGMLSARGLRRIAPIGLGTLDRVPLSITDLATHPEGGLWFSAAAEDTDNPYDDGACAGSMIGRFRDDFSLDWLAPLEPRHKIEGLHFTHAKDGMDHWLLVADNDDPAEKAPLLELMIPTRHPET